MKASLQNKVHKVDILIVVEDAVKQEGESKKTTGLQFREDFPDGQGGCNTPRPSGKTNFFQISWERIASAPTDLKEIDFQS